jgi:hypothetical protein
MLIKDRVIKKVELLSDDILKEVDDFIDFLKVKKNIEDNRWEWLSNHVNKTEDSNLDGYLDELTNYENMLAKDEIKWK